MYIKQNYSFSILYCVLCPGDDHRIAKAKTKPLVQPWLREDVMRTPDCLKRRDNCATVRDHCGQEGRYQIGANGLLIFKQEDHE